MKSMDFEVWICKKIPSQQFGVAEVGKAYRVIKWDWMPVYGIYETWQTTAIMVLNRAELIHYFKRFA
jgi:hypothetical protein